ncbi:hypothetical protein Btru_006132 [Bulinus truncatus]|nr:hypothetical protein Btru_006132 [Bulinus truncatus]
MVHTVTTVSGDINNLDEGMSQGESTSKVQHNKPGAMQARYSTTSQVQCKQGITQARLDKIKMPQRNKKSRQPQTCKTNLLQARKNPGQIGDLLPDINRIFPDGRNLLTLAIENNEGLDLVESIIKSGADVNVENSKGQTALMIAARAQRNDVLRLLIQSGAKLDVLNRKQMTALTICITNNNNIGVELLIESGADINIKTGAHKETAIELAERLGFKHLTENFMKFAPGVCVINQSQPSLLNSGMSKKDCSLSLNGIDMLRLTKELEEIRNMFSQVSRAPNVRTAIGSKKLKLLADKLHSLGAIDFQDEHGRTVLMYAAMQISDKTLEYILKFHPDVNKQDIDGKTALMHAVCSKRHLKVSTVYRLMGNRPYIQDKFGKTALMYAIDNRFQLPTETMKLLTGDAILIYDKVRGCFLYFDVSLKQLLNESAVISENDGRTHLMYALEKKPNLSLDEVKLLLGDTVNCRDVLGRTALMYAVMYHSVSVDMVSVLTGDNLNVTDDFGMTVLMYAIAKRPAIGTPILERLVGDQINVQDKQGQNALMYAIIYDKPDEFIQHLLNSGADKNIQDNDGRTAFMLAMVKRSLKESRNRSYYLFDWFFTSDSTFTSYKQRNYLCEGTFKNLLGDGINVTDKQGWTAFTYAVEYLQPYSLIQHILKCGADINIKYDSGETVLMKLLARCEGTLSSSMYDLSLFYMVENTATCKNILDSLMHSKDQILSEENRIYLSQHLRKKSCINFNWACKYNKHLLKWLLTNGIVLEQTHGVNSKFQDTSTLLVALELNEIGVAKYLIANYCMTMRDLCFLRKYYTAPVGVNLHERYLFRYLSNERYYLEVSKKTTEFVLSLNSSPWPLVKLALIAVSSAIGFHEKRQSYVSKLPIPQIMRNYLVFQSPEAKTPVDEWSDISLC